MSQITSLFDRDKSVISRHLSNIFKEGELERNSVVANFATTAADDKTYQVEHFNLDVIISVGYRIKSKRGTQFRIWATHILRQYLVALTLMIVESKADEKELIINMVVNLINKKKLEYLRNWLKNQQRFLNSATFIPLK